MSISIIIAGLLSYLMGSISSAVITCRLMKLPDPRQEGSGNPGATNVLRFGGKKAALITLIGDTSKGIIPVLIAKAYGLDTFGLSIVTFAVFLGHLYPIFFRFQGGKGVATAGGALIALAWLPGLLILATWLMTAIVLRYSSLAAILAALLGPFYMWYFTNIDYTVTTILISALLIYRHHSNIKKLWEGTEDKIGTDRP